MNKNIMLKSTHINLGLNNGESVALTLNFAKLLELRSKKKDIYDRYNKIMMNGPEDIFDNVTITYTAYLCAQEDIDNAMDEKTFIALLPPYQQTINEAVMDLTRPKKKPDSEKPSEEKATEEQSVE